MFQTRLVSSISMLGREETFASLAAFYVFELLGPGPLCSSAEFCALGLFPWLAVRPCAPAGTPTAALGREEAAPSYRSAASAAGI